MPRIFQPPVAGDSRLFPDSGHLVGQRRPSWAHRSDPFQGRLYPAVTPCQEANDPCIGVECGDCGEAGREEQPHPRRDREARGRVVKENAWRRQRVKSPNPAVVSSAIETRKVRASSRRAAASLATRPSTTFTPATVSTSQKCDGWCSHRMSRSGSASSSASAANGSASTAIQRPSLLMLRPSWPGLGGVMAGPPRPRRWRAGRGGPRAAGWRPGCGPGPAGAGRWRSPAGRRRRSSRPPRPGS
jgi:hypothetical protein